MDDKELTSRILKLVMPTLTRLARETVQQAASTGDLPIPDYRPGTVQDTISSPGTSVSVLLDGDTSVDNAIFAQNVTGSQLTNGQRVLVMKLDPHGALVVNVLGFQNALPAGLVMACMSSTSPAGFVFSYAQVVSQTGHYGRLYAAIGTQYNTGAEGAGNFRLPDLRGVVPVFLDNMGGSDRGYLDYANTLGAFHGEQYHVLSVGELAAHAHEQVVTTDINAPGGAIRTDYNTDAASEAYDQGVTTGPAGSNQGHNTVQPSILCNGVISI